jgi:hypothetical protein
VVYPSGKDSISVPPVGPPAFSLQITICDACSSVLAPGLWWFLDAGRTRSQGSGSRESGTREWNYLSEFDMSDRLEHDVAVVGAQTTRVWPGTSRGLAFQWRPTLTEGRLGRDRQSRCRPPGRGC